MLSLSGFLRLLAVVLTSVIAIHLPEQATAFTVGKPAPEITAETWINTDRLTLKQLRDRVVLVEFWTYG